MLAPLLHCGTAPVDIVVVYTSSPTVWMLVTPSDSTGARTTLPESDAWSNGLWDSHDQMASSCCSIVSVVRGSLGADGSDGSGMGVVPIVMDRSPSSEMAA